MQVIIGKEVWALLQEEKDHVVPKSSLRAGCFNSEALCRWQAQKSNEGYREVELVKSFYGWSVRAASGLQDFALLAGSRRGDIDGSLEAAIAWARRWAEKDPTKRCVFAPDDVRA